MVVTRAQHLKLKKKNIVVDYSSSDSDNEEIDIETMSDSENDNEEIDIETTSDSDNEDEDWFYEEDDLYKLFVDINTRNLDINWTDTKFHTKLIKEYLFDACTFNDHQAVDPKDWIKYISFHTQECPMVDIPEFYNVVDRAKTYFGYCAICNHNRTISKDMFVNGQYYPCGRLCCGKLQRVLDFYINMKVIGMERNMSKVKLQETFEKIMEDLENMNYYNDNDTVAM